MKTCVLKIFVIIRLLTRIVMWLKLIFILCVLV